MLQSAASVLVLSDLHLGAASSLLTAYDVDDHGAVFYRDSAKAVLDEFLAVVRQTLIEQGGGGGPIEQCVLLGDIFDFSFASYGLAMKNGHWFLHQLAQSGLFQQFVFVPGNHDHHLWQQLVEHHFVVSNMAEPVVVHPKALPVDQVLEGTFLDQLCPSPYTVKATYPNYGVKVGGRPMLFHHGHFLQPLYSAASKLLAEVLHTEDIEDLEAFNAPFLEFGWYNLGQAYNVGPHKLVDRLYFMLKNQQTNLLQRPNGLERVIQLLLAKLERWDQQVSRANQIERLKQQVTNPLRRAYHRLIQWLGPPMIKHYILSRLRLFEQRRHASTARHESIQSAIQDSARTYISQYLLPALESGGGDGRGGVFIFGHTHEPATAVPCLIPHGKDSAQPHSVDLYNTGGWLIDQLSEAGGLQLPKMNPLLIHGAGQVTPIPFLTTHFEWLETLVENDNAFKKLKAQLQAASAPMV